MYSALPAGNTFVTTEPKPTLASYPRTRPEWLHGAEYVHVKTGENYEWREGDIDPTRFRLEAEVMCRWYVVHSSPAVDSGFLAPVADVTARNSQRLRDQSHVLR